MPFDVVARPTPDIAPTPAVTLAGLMGLDTTARFFAEYWERQPRLHHSTLTQGLFDLDAFEALMAGAPVGPASWLNVVGSDGRARPVTGSAGATVCLASLYRAYQAGRTLLLTELQQRSAPVARLCRALEQELLALGVPLVQRLGANAYLTPTRARGFELHYDDHCVLVLQLAGRKRWRIHAPTTELPVARCEGALPEASVGAPILEPELAPGDVLYVPRGFPHAAHTTDGSSLHVTLSLHTLTWQALVADLLRSRVEFRRSVPLRGAQAAFATTVAPAFAPAGLDAEIDRRRRALIAALAPLPATRLRAIDAVAAGAGAGRVRRVPGVLLDHRVEGDEVVLRLPGATLRLPAAMAEVFDYIAATDAFVAADLPRIRATYDAAGLIDILIQEGLLCLQPDCATASRHSP